MVFELNKTTGLLEQTPHAFYALLGNIPYEWTSVNEGEGTWSAYDVVGHLVHCEQANWITRMNIILSDAEDKRFAPIDTQAQFINSQGKTMQQLLEEFKLLRSRNIQTLKQLNLTAADLHKTGIHPQFGEVTLAQLISTWLVHDLDHLTQTARVMAKHYKAEVGPWIEYLRILKQ
jgi:uncharacterized damage-inducible protein DinB